MPWSCFSEVKDELERLMYDVKRTANSVRTNLKGLQKTSRYICNIGYSTTWDCRCHDNCILVGVEKCCQFSQTVKASLIAACRLSCHFLFFSEITVLKTSPNQPLTT